MRLNHVGLERSVLTLFHHFGAATFKCHNSQYRRQQQYRQAGAESGLSADEVQAQSERLIDLGNSLLPAVFDGNAADAAAELARQSGIAKASAARLLAMALPLVLAHLSRNSGSLSDFLKLLAGQSDHLAENLNGGLLSALGISRPLAKVS